jgi:hypothetical protein
MAMIVPSSYDDSVFVGPILVVSDEFFTLGFKAKGLTPWVKRDGR